MRRIAACTLIVLAASLKLSITQSAESNLKQPVAGESHGVRRAMHTLYLNKVENQTRCQEHSYTTCYRTQPGLLRDSVHNESLTMMLPYGVDLSRADMSQHTPDIIMYVCVCEAHHLIWSHAGILLQLH